MTERNIEIVFFLYGHADGKQAAVPIVNK